MIKKLGIALLASWLTMCGVVFAQTASYSHAETASLTTSLVAESKPLHMLRSGTCTGITGGAAGYCIAYNGAVAPGTGSLTAANVLDACGFAASSTVGCNLNIPPEGGYQFPVGIVILISSAASPFTYTTGTDTGFITANYN